MNKSKPSGCSRPDDDDCLPGVAIEIAWGVGAFAGVFPNTPKRLIADGASGISCCSLLPLNSLRGKGGAAEGFGIGGADGVGLEKPSEPDLGVGVNPVLSSVRKASGETDEGVPISDADLLVAGVFKSTSGDAEGALLGGKDAEGALLDGWVAEDALLDAGVFKSTSGDTEGALPSGRDLLDAGVGG